MKEVELGQSGETIKVTGLQATDVFIIEIQRTGVPAKSVSVMLLQVVLPDTAATMASRTAGVRLQIVA